MTPSYRHALSFLHALLLLSAALFMAGTSTRSLAAPPKMREGFASRVSSGNSGLIPTNTISRGRAYSDVYFFIQWQDAVPSSKLRCVIKGPDADIDDVEDFETEAGGYSICGIATDNEDVGTYRFAQYLNGELVGEMTIDIDAAGSRTSLRKQFKYWLGLLSLLIIAIYWVYRWKTGDKRSLQQVIGGESKEDKVLAEARMQRDAIRIGSGIGEKPLAEDPNSRAALSAQFRSLINQPDKAPALEVAQRFITQCVKDREQSEALGVFRECLAVNPAFRPGRGEDALPLAKAARAAGEVKLAVAALRGFDKNFPGHANIPDVFVFSAKIMAEDMKNTDMAKKIYQHVLDKYPGHYMASEAKRGLQALG